MKLSEDISDITRKKLEEIFKSNDVKKVIVQKLEMNGVLILEVKLNGDEKFHFIVDPLLNIETLNIIID